MATISTQQSRSNVDKLDGLGYALDEISFQPLGQRVALGVGTKQPTLRRKHSYPVEVAWVFEDGRSRSFIIKPSARMD